MVERSKAVDHPGLTPTTPVRKQAKTTPQSNRPPRSAGVARPPRSSTDHPGRTVDKGGACRAIEWWLSGRPID
jgi:hypothetical protein